MGNTYSVYVHVNRENGKRYVGITSQKPQDRWLNGRGYQSNNYFNNAIQKYGWDAFDHIIVKSNLSKSEAEQMEIELIAKYDSSNREFGYNIQLGGSAAGKHSEETKRKISQSHIGIGHSDETKKKLSSMFKGRKIPSDWRAKITASQTGLKRSPETGKRISEKVSIPVICVNSRTVYKSLTDASLSTNTQLGHISSCCNGKRPRAGTDCNGDGLYWMFYDEYLENGLDSKTNDEIIPKLKKCNKQFPIRCVETGIVYSSVKDAHIKTNISTSSLSQCLSGKTKSSGGFHWEYVVDCEADHGE